MYLVKEGDVVGYTMDLFNTKSEAERFVRNKCKGSNVITVDSCSVYELRELRLGVVKTESIVVGSFVDSENGEVLE